MDKEFWYSRWEKNEIGFHLTMPHHKLRKFFRELQVLPGAPVLVPLCGKSPDLVWLREQGLTVTGVELSRVAIEALISENALLAEWTTEAGMPCCHADGYQIYCGDFFKLSTKELIGIRALYDRGSLVALPPEMRARYAAHIATLLPSGGRVLLIGYEYDQAETDGPPFSVPFSDLEGLFCANFQLELLAEDDALWSHRGLAERGVTKLTEYAVLLVRN
jgi:thiopurine S-methyltransferase